MVEPVFSIHIDFEDGSNPIVYYAQKLTDAADILKEWSVNWILVPDVRSYLDGIWYFHARAREDNGMSWPEFKESVKEELKGEQNGSFNKGISKSCG